MKVAVVAGRILFSFIFLMTIMSHFNRQTIEYAASMGVPEAGWLVPLSGILAFTGALSIILGYKAPIGALLIITFLVPVTYYMHGFWREADPMHAQMQMAHFMKNVSLIGAAMMIHFFGSGPWSLDNREKPKITVKGFTTETIGPKEETQRK